MLTVTLFLVLLCKGPHTNPNYEAQPWLLIKRKKRQRNPAGWREKEETRKEENDKNEKNFNEPTVTRDRNHPRILIFPYHNLILYISN